MSENKKGRQGLTLVYTGHGKGKTTAALGLALRSIGRGYQVKILQFIKSPQRSYGEQIALKKLGVEMVQLGIGFTWLKTPEEHREALKKAWPQARDAVMSGEYDVVIWDELNNALAIDKFPTLTMYSLWTKCWKRLKINLPTSISLSQEEMHSLKLKKLPTSSPSSKWRSIIMKMG